MSPPHGQQADREPFKLWDHIGVISGVILGLILAGFLVLLAFAGGQGALAILVVIVVGVLFIIVGGRIRGGHGRL